MKDPVTDPVTGPATDPATTPAAHLHHRTIGTGGVRVLALHCGLGQGGMWKGVAAHLPETTITAPDLPGHGRSAPFPSDIDVHDWATDAMAPHVTGQTHLVGHSFGATVALRLALNAPQRALSLTLIEPVFFAAAPDSPTKTAHRSAEEAFFATFADDGDLAAARAFNRLWGGGVPWDSFKPPVQAAMAAQMDFVVRTEPSLWQDRAALLTQDRLNRLTCPIRLIRGSDSVPIIAEIHKGLLRRMPHASETVIDGAGHMLVLTHPRDVAKVIAPLLASSG